MYTITLIALYVFNFFKSYVRRIFPAEFVWTTHVLYTSVFLNNLRAHTLDHTECNLEVEGFNPSTWALLICHFFCHFYQKTVTPGIYATQFNV